MTELQADVKSWDTDAVIAWLSGLESISGPEVDDLIASFRSHQIQGEDLFALDREDLKDLGITRIPQIRKIRTAIDALKKESGDDGNTLLSPHTHNPTATTITTITKAKKATMTLGPISKRTKTICPALHTLLGTELANQLDAPPLHATETTDAEYWLRVELLFVLRAIILLVREEIANSVRNTHACDERSVPDLPYRGATVPELMDRLDLAEDLLVGVEASLKSVGGDGAAGRSPLFVRVAEAYGLGDSHRLVVQFVVVVRVQRSASLRLLLSDVGNGNGVDDVNGSLIQLMCGISQLEITRLTDDTHPLMKDRIIETQEEQYSSSTPKYLPPDEVCKAFLGVPLSVEDKLKISDTLLLSVVNGALDVDDISILKQSDAEPNTTDQHISTEQTSTQATVSNMLRTIDPNSTLEDLESTLKDEAHLEKPTIPGQNTTQEEQDAPKDTSHPSPPPSDSSSAVTADEWEPRPYNCELEYLTDQFSLVMQQVQVANQRHAQDLKEASVAEKPRWMQNGDKKNISIAEVTAKVRLAQRKIDLSLQLTREGGKFYPRLEGLIGQLGLDVFEKSVILYLCGSMISPIFKSSISQDSYSSRRKCTVGDLLLVFCTTVSQQVSHRTYFYQSSKLIQKGLVRVRGACSIGGSDLTDQELLLDRRVLDCIVGLDKESTEVVQGSHLYNPKVDIETVVLPPKLKQTITDAVAHFDKFRAYRNSSKFDEAVSYGVGLTLMFCGPSGTGKTMTANAIAAKLGKKLLLVNFPGLKENRGEENGSCYQSIFREAELSEAIIFFDECESLFAKRDRSGSGHVNELLMELERFEGIVFLATNRPFDLDEAMYRRISEVFEFSFPNYVERLKIWQLVTKHNAIPCEEDIDWDAIALQYELSGGFIKNVVIAALLSAVGRNSTTPKITQSDIINGCKKQVRGALQMNDFDQRVLPSSGLEEAIVSDSVKEQLQAMVDIEKARGILFGLWGFDDNMRDRQGTTALFWGPPGTGRSKAAEAIGFELGKPLKVVNFPQLLGESGKEYAKAVHDVFSEARLMDAVLVLDGHSLKSKGADGTSDDDNRLLNLVVREMTRFPGVVIMMLDTAGSLDIFISRLDKGLLNGLKFLVEFNQPNFQSRLLIWKKIMPTSVPTSGKIDPKALSKASENFNFLQICNALYRAAAVAALRSEKERYVNMSDLLSAIKDEKNRGESEIDRWMKSQYI